MRIDAYMQVNQVYNANKPKRTMKTGGGAGTDSLEISDFGKDYQIAKQATKNVPEVREAKIQDIQKQMAAGTYNVSIEDVAEKLADKLLG